MKIKIAGICFSVETLFASTEKYFSGYLSEEEPERFITISQDDVNFERLKSDREAQVEGIAYINRSDSQLEIIAVQRKVTEELLLYDTLLFHGSVIAVDGVAYLFTAKSGTGKSTHTRLWREMLGERAVMVNDDKPFLSVKDDKVMAYGSPWNGKHKLGNNISVPLSAICILERGEVNEIKRIPASKAVPMLIQQSSRPKAVEFMSKYMELLDGIARKVRFYKLFCNMELDAAVVSYTEMTKDNDKEGIL